MTFCYSLEDLCSTTLTYILYISGADRQWWAHDDMASLSIEIVEYVPP